MHFYWSHSEPRNAYPIHFTLLAAQCSPNDICILCSALDCNCTPISEMAADLRHLLSGKAGGLKRGKKRSVIVWPLCVIASKPTGVWSYVFIAFAQSEWPPLPVSVCSLPLLCSLSEDWGEPVSPCDEGLLRDAAALSGTGEQCCTEATGCWRGSVAQHLHHSLPTQLIPQVLISQLMCMLTWYCGFSVFIHVKDKTGVYSLHCLLLHNTLWLPWSLSLVL